MLIKVFEIRQQKTEEKNPLLHFGAIEVVIYNFLDFECYKCLYAKFYAEKFIYFCIEIKLLKKLE